MTSKLLIPSAEERQSCQRLMSVCGDDLVPAKFPGWEDEATRFAEILLNEIATELQARNDCQANALATGEEARSRLLTGKMQQFSRTYGYNACEYLSSPSRVGSDQGTTIDSGVILMTQGIKSLGISPGLPTEDSYKYGTYERSSSRFVERAKSAVIVPSSVANHGPVPKADKMPLVCAVGGSCHGGVFWAPKFEYRTFGGRKWKVWTTAPQSGGGHALAFGIFVVWIEEHKCFWPCIWNSHGDGPILIPPELWDVYCDRQWNPFGGYMMLPDKPEEKFHDRLASGGGYFRPRNQGVA
jgi:hypothetical protein